MAPHGARAALLLLLRAGCVSGLPGHPLPLDDHPTAGVAEDLNGNAWVKGSQWGLKNGGKVYYVENAGADNWWGAGFVRFDLRGKTLSFATDLSGVPCGCVATLYFVAMGNPGPGAPYCDIQPGRGWNPCFELDIMEANSHAFHSSLHSQQGTAYDGSCNARIGCVANVGRYPFTRYGQKTSDLYGPGSAGIDSTKPFQVEAVFDAHGSMSVQLEQDGKTVPLFNRSSAANVPSAAHDKWNWGAYPKPGGVPDDAVWKTNAAFQTGLVMVSTLWTGDTHWLDTAACNGQQFCNLNSAWFTVQDFQVKSSTQTSTTVSSTTASTTSTATTLPATSTISSTTVSTTSIASTPQVQTSINPGSGANGTTAKHTTSISSNSSSSGGSSISSGADHVSTTGGASITSSSSGGASISSGADHVSTTVSARSSSSSSSGGASISSDAGYASTTAGTSIISSSSSGGASTSSGAGHGSTTGSTTGSSSSSSSSTSTGTSEGNASRSSLAMSTPARPTTALPTLPLVLTLPVIPTLPPLPVPPVNPSPLLPPAAATPAVVQVSPQPPLQQTAATAGVVQAAPAPLATAAPAAATTLPFVDLEEEEGREQWAGPSFPAGTVVLPAALGVVGALAALLASGRTMGARAAAAAAGHEEGHGLLVEEAAVAA